MLASDSSARFSRRPRRRTRTSDPATPIIKALIPSVYAPTAIYAIGSGAISPVLVLAAAQVGMSHAAAAGLVGLLGVVGVVSAPLAGSMVGRWGGKSAMMVGTIMSVVPLLGMLAAMTWSRAWPTGWGGHTFVLAVIALGMAGNLWGLARQGYVADAVPAWARARTLSFLGGMMRLGVLLGPAIGSGAIIVAGRRGPFILAILACVLAMACVMVYALPTAHLRSASHASPSDLPSQGGDLAVSREARGQGAQRGGSATSQHESGLRPAATRTKVDWPATAVVAVAMTCLQLLRTNRSVLVPLWGAHLGMSDELISATFAAGALMDVAMFIPSGRWMDRYGRLAGIVPALGIMGASIVVTTVWTSPLGFVIGTCLMGFGNGFGSGIVMTMGADLAPSPGRERFLGWWQGIGNIGSAAGPFIVSALTASVGLAAGMWATALLGISASAWAASAMRWAYRHAGMDMRGRALTPPRR